MMPRFAEVEEGATRDDRWVRLSLEGIPHITEEVYKLSRWLTIGPFPVEDSEDMTKKFPPEEEFVLGKLYQYGDQQLAWGIPKVEILADVIDADPLWGTLYDWNYHTAGFAWAVRVLGEYTEEKRFVDYMNRYCNFMIDIKPYIMFEKYTLRRPYSRHTHIHNTPLLDFTSAPALPFVYRLIQEDSFDYRDHYEKLFKDTLDYIRNDQLRASDGTFIRETPFKYTTWVDDMFMGIPFLLLSAQLVEDESVRRELSDDAARQVFGFHKRVYDPEVDLYMHARYSESPESKLPYWSRANGWGIWAVTEVLLHLPSEHPSYEEILEIYRRHVNGIVAMQNKETGFYHNVLDRPESFEETSGTAIFTMAIARGINNGWIDRGRYLDFAIKGWKALDSVIGEDGKVTDICMGTMCSEDVKYYFNRPVVEDDSHGLLGLIFAGIEMQMLFDGIK